MLSRDLIDGIFGEFMKGIIFFRRGVLSTVARQLVSCSCRRTPSDGRMYASNHLSTEYQQRKEIPDSGQ
jgi:hypothetical protein